MSSQEDELMRRIGALEKEVSELREGLADAVELLLAATYTGMSKQAAKEWADAHVRRSRPTQDAEDL